MKLWLMAMTLALAVLAAGCSNGIPAGRYTNFAVDTPESQWIDVESDGSAKLTLLRFEYYNAHVPVFAYDYRLSEPVAVAEGALTDVSGLRRLEWRASSNMSAVREFSSREWYWNGRAIVAVDPLLSDEMLIFVPTP